MALLRRPEAGAVIGTVVVFAFFVGFAGGKGFLGFQGVGNWLGNAAEIGIGALAVGVLIIAGEFDLSMGSVLAVGALTVGLCTGYYHWPLWASIALALALGVIIGLFNGLIVVRTGLHSFLVTLATQFLLYGAMLGFARLLTGQTTLIVTFTGAARVLFAGTWDYFPAEVAWWLGLTALVTWVLSKTVFGNWIYATGGNLRTARMAGVKTAQVKISCFVFTAVASVLVGIIETAQTSTVSVEQGQLYEFEVIIAAVVGGVLMTGGYGSAIGVLFGSLTYGIADLGIFYTGWNTDWFQAFLGGLLLVAVLSNSWLRRKMLSTR